MSHNNKFHYSLFQYILWSGKKLIFFKERSKAELKFYFTQYLYYSHIKLIMYLSVYICLRRQVEVEGAQPLTMEEALARSDVHALLICTENEHHERLAR